MRPRLARATLFFPGPLLILLLSVLLLACGDAAPAGDAGRRTWGGPTTVVASEGLFTYDRREYAQRVPFPTCITIGATTFRFERVIPAPAGDPATGGLLDSGYSLDRWRLLAPAGPLDEQQTVHVQVRGATGILGRYPRSDQPCCVRRRPKDPDPADGAGASASDTSDEVPRIGGDAPQEPCPGRATRLCFGHNES